MSRTGLSVALVAICVAALAVHAGEAAKETKAAKWAPAVEPKPLSANSKILLARRLVREGLLTIRRQ